MEKQKGITFVEVLVTLGLLALSTALLVMLLTHINQNIKFTKNYQIAYQLAQNKFESLNNENITSGSDTILSNHVIYECVWHIETKKLPFDYKTFSISVSWYDNENKYHSVKLDGVLPPESSNQSGKILLSFINFNGNLGDINVIMS